MVESTHDLEFTRDRVMKRFRSWDRDEPEREWAGLAVLHRYAPGLAPQPLQRRTEDGVPVIVMSRLRGEPLGGAPLTRHQVAALSQTLREMHAAVPAHALADLPQRRSGPAEQCSRLRSWIAEPPPALGPPISVALNAASSWLGSNEEVRALAGPLAEKVFTHGDGNPANFLWDGARCGVVDFEDAGISDLAYEAADLIEHVSAWLPGIVDGDALAESLGFSKPQRARLLGFRRLMAVFWLLMLLPGKPGHHRNPPGSMQRQAERVLGLL